MSAGQFTLFPDPAVPEGLAYEAEFLSSTEESEIAAQVSKLQFAPFEFHGFEGKRRVASFGWRYVFDGTGLTPADPVPDFLLGICARAARFAGIQPAELEHALITEYAPGAGIGWHKDRSVFGETIGISLLAPCRLRFRRRRPNGWDRFALGVEPRSIYLLRGAARSEWEHSISPGSSLRYSITLRTLAADRPG